MLQIYVIFIVNEFPWFPRNINVAWDRIHAQNYPVISNGTAAAASPGPSKINVRIVI